jgi:hypothetical protein
MQIAQMTHACVPVRVRNIHIGGASWSVCRGGFDYYRFFCTKMQLNPPRSSFEDSVRSKGTLAFQRVNEANKGRVLLFSYR